MTMQIKTGQELKTSRKALGMSQERFAHCAAVTRNTVYNWEQHDKLPFIVGLGLGELVIRLSSKEANHEP